MIILRYLGWIFFATLFVSAGKATAQTPANDECSGAITLTPGTQLLCPGATSGTTTGATQSTTVGQPDCSFGNIDDDVWYKFVAINDKHIVSMTGGSPLYYPAFEVYSGTCGNLTSLGVCVNGATAGTSALLTGLNVGSTYYIRAYSYLSNNGYRGSFTICVTSIPNDECLGAPSLTINSSCIPVFGDTKYATQSNVTGEPLCSTHTGWNDDDLWFKFTTPSNPASSYIVDVDANPFTLGYRLTSPNMSFYTGSCGNLNLLSASCTTPVSGCPYRQVVSLSGLAANTTYYIRVYSWVTASSYRGQFNICVSTGAGTGTSTITATPDSLTFGSLCIGDSLTRTFALNGSNLTAGSINVGPLTGYSFSSDNVNFFNSLSIATCGGSFSSTIYVRFKPTVAQAYNGNIPISGTSVAAINVSVSGAGNGGVTPGKPTLAAASTTICSGGSVTLNVQSGSLNGASGWKWYSGSCGGVLIGSGTSVNVSPASSTTYFARGEGGSCVSPGLCDSIRVTVGAPTAAITPSTAQLTCTATTAQLTASGGGAYLWSNGSTNASITVNSAGSYTVTVTGSGNCSAIASASVTANVTNPSAAINPPSFNLTCVNSSVTLTASGGGTYAWSTGASAAAIQTSSAGTYTVTVTNAANGCTATASAVVSSTSTVNAVITQVNTSCGLNNGSADAGGSTGSGTLSFRWSNGASSASVTNLPAGNYSVTVQDGAGCSSSASAIIDPSSSPQVTVTADKDTICSKDSSLVCSASGFTAYLWNTGDTSSCIYAKSQGNYQVTATDNANCTADAATNITVNPIPSVSIIVSGDTLSSFGGASYQWLLNGTPVSGATGPVYIPREPGNYQLQLTDAKGCSAVSSGVQVNTKPSGIAEVQDHYLEVYPNPNHTNDWILNVGSFYIGSPIKIYDTGGRLVYLSVAEHSTQIISPDIASGIYILTLDAVTVQRYLKLVKL